MATLTIYGRLPGLNEVIGANRGPQGRYIGAKLKRETDEKIIVQIAEQIPDVRFHGAPVKITYTWYEANRKRDLDNIASAKKFINDALVKAGTLENDGWKNVGGFVDHFEIDKDNPRVEVTIEWQDEKLPF